MGNAMATGTTTALVTASGCVFQVTSGRSYKFEFQALWNCNVTTNGFKIGLTFPAAITVAANAWVPITASTQVLGPITASGGSVTGTSTPTSATTYMAEISGTITPSGSGALALMWACELSTTGGVALLAGTNGILYQLN
jgi:hypothetical protein